MQAAQAKQTTTRLLCLPIYAMYQHPPKHIAYGTAGFRDHADALDVVLFRVGLVAALRARVLGKTVGVVITASHNPPADNGAKIVDPTGDMLESSWEARVECIANAQTHAACLALVEKCYHELGVHPSAEAHVVFGRDTRASGAHLAEVLKQGLDVAHCAYTDCGFITTPQLHYIVRALNFPEFGEPTLAGYYRKLADAFAAVTKNSETLPSINVDCANGVGALKLLEMAPNTKGLVNITVTNSQYNNPESLNVECGADYVKTLQRLPSKASAEPGQLCCSFDGDADRVVFYFVDAQKKFCLLDGDHIAVLAARFFKRFELGGGPDIGVVQTAYANGSSTAYIANELRLPVECTPTGVKHLHHVAQKFGIGIYFEANGHGTVLFDQQKLAKSGSQAALEPWTHLINQTVGDAISDMFMVLGMLRVLNMSCEDWFALYADLPNRLLKASVRDRTEFVTTDAERRLTQPSDVQEKIDELVKAVPKGRCFVRASGTEDVVRVYAEAETQDSCDALAQAVQKYISDHH